MELEYKELELFSGLLEAMRIYTYFLVKYTQSVLLIHNLLVNYEKSELLENILSWLKQLSKFIFINKLCEI